ncbi:TetR/AcrR family transcriptional regulator [Sphingomonas bacterium]|uniref:TetR/AcrR family transcriptional regulator n=1 Tax=Sphingomonas bacterium TaxID=1895847 RepID=UPI001575D1C3|nr:TetR/AcrR family transcriptional regulator [Sphingomonas bacterium]
MELFWRHGYEGVSISDLTHAIGVAPPSLYAAFGSKARLYHEALDRYAVGALDLSVLDEASDLRDGVAAMLAAAIGSVHAKGQACMISTGMLACDPAHDALARDLADRRRTFEHNLQEKLARWLPAAEAASLARYIVAVMQGISVHASDGATLPELESIADHAKAALPKH